MGSQSAELQLLESALEALQKAKPNDRSEKNRRFAVSITELEKVIAYFKVFIEFAE